MKNTILLCCAMLLAGQFYAQVGIGTTSPNPKSMLEVSSTSDGGATYKGFMPPRVPNVTARDAINPTAADVGLLVFVEASGCLEVWNGSGWESVHCINSAGFTDLFQNFDLSTSWGYNTDVPFFDNGVKGYYGITNSSNGGFSNITTLTNDFLGILDLNDTEDGNGTSGFANITFNTIDISGASNGVTVSFEYEFYEFDDADDAYYTVVIDGNPQSEVTLIEGIDGGGTGNGVSTNGVVSETIPPGTNNVSLRIRIRQNGQGDYAGFDNFAIVAN